MPVVEQACQACEAPIFWLRHERTGRWAPIEAEPRSDGNILVDLEGETYRIVDAEPPLPGIEPVAALRLNHFARCLDAKRFKRRPKAAV